MKPLKFYVFPRRQVERITDIHRTSADFLKGWESIRPDVLKDDSIDIFLPNCRTHAARWHDYSLFQRVESVDSDALVVVQSWLEILMAAGQRQQITNLIEAIRGLYPDAPKLYSWNHDSDQATMPEFRGLPENEFVACYNTSVVRKNDIVLPFWAIDCWPEWNPEETNRMVHGSFVGYVGRVECRRKMLYAFRDKPGWEVSDTRVPKDEYLGLMCCSDFALCPRGGGLGSYRTYEAIQCGAIPIIFSDGGVLPYPDLPYADFCIRLPESAAGDFEAVKRLTYDTDVGKMRLKLAAVRQRFSLAGVQAEIHKHVQEFLK